MMFSPEWLMIGAGAAVGFGVWLMGRGDTAHLQAEMHKAAAAKPRSKKITGEDRMLDAVNRKISEAVLDRDGKEIVGGKIATHAEAAVEKRGRYISIDEATAPVKTGKSRKRADRLVADPNAEPPRAPRIKPTPKHT
ncbi:hypothetical protein [Paracoccus litorisediminis]|uniref:Uncharacterized protein n=1 Tax=Paracoccus litorisediminis TaxID=2006130 RepID=A0A844HUB4_9RHOB|nr:hypothetical protein [Paracoccus litorisediminis]MTH61102.1 hypothetical protein [Paracoccus litorisediminis]